MDTKALRQKILDLAIRGKLVPQDPNDEPASVLLERIRAEKQQMVKDGRLKAKDIKNDTVIFVGEDNLHYEKFADGTVKCIEDEIPFEVPDGWTLARLGSIAEADLGKMLDAAKNKGFPRPYLRNINVRWGAFDLTDLLEMRIQDEEVERYSIQKGDLVVCEGGEPGRCAIWEAETAVFFQKALHRVRPHLVLSEYLFFVINAYTLLGLTEQYFTGTTIKHLTGQSLKALLIPVPPIQEQERLSNAAKEALSYVDLVEKNRSDLIAVISLAKERIFDLAIRGKLIPQNPDDEPASVLLERIRTEKEVLIKQGKIKRDKRDSVIFRGEDNSYYETIGGITENIDEEVPFEIPDTWCFARLNSIYVVNPKNDVEDETTVSFVPMALIDDQFTGHFTCEIKPWRECKRGFTHFADGDVGFAKISPCFENRKSAIFFDLENGYGAGTTELFILRSYCNTILPEYTLNLVKSGYFINRGKGTFSGVVGQQRIDKNVVFETLVPIPPVGEQRRIVKRIAQLFSLLDAILSAVE